MFWLSVSTHVVMAVAEDQISAPVLGASLAQPCLAIRSTPNATPDEDRILHSQPRPAILLGAEDESRIEDPEEQTFSHIHPDSSSFLLVSAPDCATVHLAA